MAHSNSPVLNLPGMHRKILPVAGVEDLAYRSLSQTFSVHPHYTFGPDPSPLVPEPVQIYLADIAPPPAPAPVPSPAREATFHVPIEPVCDASGQNAKVTTFACRSAHNAANPNAYPCEWLAHRVAAPRCSVKMCLTEPHRSRLYR